MKVTEAAALTPAKQVEDSSWGKLAVTSAARKQYLETAKGHYLSAFAGLNTGKQEQTTFDHACQQAEDMEASTQGRTRQLRVFPGTNVEMFKACEKQFHAVKVKVHNPLARNTKAQISEMVDRLLVFRRGMNGLDAEELEAVQTVPSDWDDNEESLLKGVAESSSLQKMVKSLKAELQSLKKHTEFKDDHVGTEFVPKSRRSKLSYCKSENAVCLAKEVKRRHESEEITQNQTEMDGLQIKAKGLKREYGTLNSCTDVEKRPRIALDVDDAKMATMSVPNQSKSLPGRSYVACVSTSESSARFMNSDDELESSIQKPEKADKLERGISTAMKGRIEADDTSEFSIREFVFCARNKDISTNWPFSQKNLQRCLKHGVKNVLPPFQPMDSFKDGSLKQCVAEKCLPSEESTLVGRPSKTKSRLVPGATIDYRWNLELAEGYRDSNSFPSGDKDLVFKANATDNFHSEVESVSTSNLLSGEVVSDEQEAAASAVNTIKSSASQLSNKKSKVGFRLRLKSSRGVPDDITSACTGPSEGMASKICPVCESFSSSSNTTLNAHIDQCLSSESTPIWENTPKLIKPRIKPRKIRLMVDICATAPCGTLEDLDKRNGTSWATTGEATSGDVEAHTEGNNLIRLSSKYVVNNRDDGSVYIDSNGRKIRILSKFTKAEPSLLSPKPRTDLKPKKQPKKGSRSKFLSANRKRRLAKHLKNLRVTRQRKQFSSLKFQSSCFEACGAEIATCGIRERHVEQQPSISLAKEIKAQEQKNSTVSGTSNRWVSSLTANLPRGNGTDATTKYCRYDLRAAKGLRMVNNRVTRERKIVSKDSRLPKKQFSSFKCGLRASVSHIAVAEQKNVASSGGLKVGSPPASAAAQGNKQTFSVPLELGAPEFNEETSKECVRSVDSLATPASSFERNIKNQPIAIPIADSGSEDEQTKLWSSDTAEQCGAKPVRDSNQDSPDINRVKEFVDGVRGDYGFVRSLMTRHDNRELFVPVPSTSLAIEENVLNLSTSLDPELRKGVDVFESPLKSLQCPDKFQLSLSRDESRIYFPQHCISDMHEMFYRNITDAERFELKTGDVSLNFGHGSSLMQVEPIPIPGPPGSDLPCFSDMGSEDLHRTSSSSSSLAHCSGDADSVVDNSSDSHLSAKSTISNLDVADECTVNEQESFRVSLPVCDNVYAGSLGACLASGLETSTIFPQCEKITYAVDSSRKGFSSQGRGLTTLRSDNQQCCCSRKQGIPWSAVTSFQESQILGQRTASLLTLPREYPTDASLAEWSNSLNSTSSWISCTSCPRVESENLVGSVQSARQSITSLEISGETTVPCPGTGDCDSASPAPILRLMGKNLMVINKEEVDFSRPLGAQNVYIKQVHPLADISSSVERSWLPVASQSVGIIGLLPSEQDPYTPASDMYNRNKICSFSVVGAAPVQR